MVEVMPVLPGQDVPADLAGRPALLREASERALACLGGLAERPVAPAADAVAALCRGRCRLRPPASGVPGYASWYGGWGRAGKWQSSGGVNS